MQLSEIAEFLLVLGAMTTQKNQKVKTVLITGGGSGIGFETAKLLVAENYRIILLGRNREKLQEAARSLGGASDRVSIHTCDLRDPASIKKTVQKIEGTHKGLYGLVNNAGVYPLGGISDTSAGTWDEAMEVNVKGPFLLIQAFAKAMAKNPAGGRIVNISSTAGILPNHFALAYSVSKAAMVHLTRTLAKEMGKDNITVNCVCPGIVRTPLHETYHTSKSELEQFYAKRGASLPLGRIGEPSDVAGAVKFFLSEQASWVTGETLVVDGGRLLS
ncbi:MAG: SDR family oxidoreductase [Bdellovibrio sp.]|nr:SDR family oxidoreductase [Bdellovibrio sp.]